MIDSGAWTRALDELVVLTDSRFVLVSAVDLRSGQYAETRTHGADDGRFLDGMADYASELYKIDPTLEYAMRNPLAGVIALSSARERSNQAEKAHAFTTWMEDALGTGDIVVRYTPPTSLALGVSLHPSAARGRHDPHELELFATIFPHIGRAVALAARPPDFEGGTEARLLVDRAGMVCAINVAADRLIGQADGLTIRSGRLRALRTREDQRIAGALRSALGAIDAGTTGGWFAIDRPSGRRPWIIGIAPLPRPPFPYDRFGPTASVRIIDPEASLAESADSRWAQAFGLTPAERRLVSALMTGDGSLRTVADRLGIAYATARVQLSSVFDKVGVRSQTQLARLLTRIGGWVMALWSGIDQAASAWV